MLNQPQQVFEQIKKANTILVTTAQNPSDEAVASALATYLYLQKLGKKTDIVIDNYENHEQLKFLSHTTDIKTILENLRKFIISLDLRQTKVGQIQYKAEKESLDFIVSPVNGFFSMKDVSTRSSDFKYDLIITISTKDLESLGKIYERDNDFFYQTTIINIDHQPANESYGQINIINLNAVSTAEQLFELFQTIDRSVIDENIATCLLTAIIVATKSFKTNNVTPTTLTTSSQLITLGARRDEIVNNLYRSRSLNLLKLWGLTLARLTTTQDGKIISSIINPEDFEKTKTTANDLKDVIDELIVNVPQAKIIILAYKNKETIEKTEAIVFGVKNLNIMELLSKFNPVGTNSRVDLTSQKSLKEFEKEILDQLSEKIVKLDI